VRNVASGLIRDINIDSIKQALKGPLQKDVSVPIPPDNSDYLPNLSDEQLRVFNLYQ
jgi:hypothetical protein